MQAWNAHTDWDTVCRRAAGRARWNAVRRLLREVRRRELLRLLVAGGGPMAWGLQKRIAAALGVSESTISRDLRGILAPERWGHCPTCGIRRHTPEDWERLDAAIRAYGDPADGEG